LREPSAYRDPVLLAGAGSARRREWPEFQSVPAGLVREYNINGKIVSVTPRKFIVHILLHEVRHWAQIATILRLNGITGNFPDFLFSPILAGNTKR
jgi:uncharacterized damage-inducible protein DinB